MKIFLLAADSMGTRSMATFIQTKDVKILIDPSVALGPYRYGLSPHKKEIKKMEKDWKEIRKYAKKASVLIVTHYHFDHHDPARVELFKGKIALLKHPTENINKSQKGRAKYFLEQLRGVPKKLEFCDGKKFMFGKTLVKFSPAVFHGANNKLGYVTEVLVKEGKKKFLFTSDVEGPNVKNQVDFILKNKPEIVYLDGPLSYMVGYRYSFKSLNAAVKNMKKIVKMNSLKTLIVDHHFLRDLKWRERIKEVFAEARKRKKKIQSAAEFMEKEESMLEARRKELWKK